MLVLAAIIESFLRQSHLSSEARLIFAAVSAAVWIAYLARGVVIERGARRAMVKEYSTDGTQ
jgi:hypothetical protein